MNPVHLVFHVFSPLEQENSAHPKLSVQPHLSWQIIPSNDYWKCVGQKGNNYPQLSVQAPPNWHQCPPLSDLAPSLPSASPPVPFLFWKYWTINIWSKESILFPIVHSSCWYGSFVKIFYSPTFILALLNPLQYSKTLHLRISRALNTHKTSSWLRKSFLAFTC